MRKVPELEPTSCRYHWPFEHHILAWFLLTTLDLNTTAVGCSLTSRSVCLPTTRTSPSSTLRSIGSNRRGKRVKESIAGTIRIAILPFVFVPVAEGVVTGGLVTDDGADSARLRAGVLSVVTARTSRLIGV